MSQAQLLNAAHSCVPFDAIADQYDERFTNSSIGLAQRSLVWKVLETAFPRGSHIIDIGCGTGVDASFLAQRGVQVTACDSSPRMIEITTRRAEIQNLSRLIHPLVLPAEQLGHLRRPSVFDGALSNFGPLNCVRDTRQFATDLARLVRPGGTAVLCWMGRFCFWETCMYLFRGDLTKAFRRFRPNGVIARLDDAAAIEVFYRSVRKLRLAFEPYFELKSLRGIGMAVPPSYCEPWIQRFPRFLNAATKFDQVTGRWPGFRTLADHVLISFERNAS